MFLGYNTNGLADHDFFTALELLAEWGYSGVGLTLDYHTLNPYADDYAQRLTQTRQILTRLGFASAIETGARFLLDPRHKHEPTLLSADPTARQKRVEFLCRAIDTAADLGSACMSCWAGTVRDGAPFNTAFERLVAGLEAVLEHAERRGVDVGFEPEPGMLIDTQVRFAELLARLPHPRLKLTLDVGHLHCQGELPLADQIRTWAPLLVNVHIEDMRAGVHEHLLFGDGEIDFPPVIAALADSGYRHGVYVELSRQSHMAPVAARLSHAFLAPLVASLRPA